MHSLALSLAAASVVINGIAFALSGLFNEPKAGWCFAAAAALSLLALFVGHDDVTALAWILMAATLAAIGAMGAFAIGAHQGRREEALEPGRSTQVPEQGRGAVEGPARLNDAWGYLAFVVPAVVPAAASLAALLN
jgi:hypothetical protein